MITIEQKMSEKLAKNRIWWQYRHDVDGFGAVHQRWHEGGSKGWTLWLRQDRVATLDVIGLTARRVQFVAADSDPNIRGAMP